MQLFIPIPIRTDRSLRAVPYVTYALLFLNVLIYLSTLGDSEAQLYAYQQHWGLTITHPTLPTLFTFAFIHGDLEHLLGNMLLLWIVGTVLEAGIGSVLFLLLYIAGLFSSVLLYGLIWFLFVGHGQAMPLIGASGAIAGTIGFATFRYYHVRILNIIALPNILPLLGIRSLLSAIPIIPIPAPFWVPFWVYAVYFGGKELLFALTLSADGVAHWAHLGGMGLGMLTALLLRSYQDGERELVLEGSLKAANEGAPTFASREELQRLLRQLPDDPELLEAAAGLAMLEGEVANGQHYYRQAIVHFFQRGFPERAAINYLNLLHATPEAVLDQRTQLTLASTLESLKHYPEAAQAFVLLATSYPRSTEAETALLRAAQLHLKHLHDTPSARRLLTTLLEDYPASHWHTLAHDRLREIEG